MGRVKEFAPWRCVPPVVNGVAAHHLVCRHIEVAEFVVIRWACTQGLEERGERNVRNRGERCDEGRRRRPAGERSLAPSFFEYTVGHCIKRQKECPWPLMPSYRLHVRTLSRPG